MLPEEMRGWKMTRMEGDFVRTADGIETTVEGSQGVAVCLLSAPGAKEPDFKLSDAEKKKIRYVQNLMQFASGNRERIPRIIRKCSRQSWSVSAMPNVDFIQ